MNLLRWELYLHGKGYLVAGLDEVGRGPLAGPVVAAAVILPLDFSLPGLKDSKLLSKKARKDIYQILLTKALGIGIGKVGPLHIDRINILQASLLAMERALGDLKEKVDYLLIDGLYTLPSFPNLPQKPLVKGEMRSLSIAAASVVAKVRRDAIMEKMALYYPQYGFAENKGYPTPSHLKALKTFGPTPVHRRSFQPVTRHQLSLWEKNSC